MSTSRRDLFKLAAIAGVAGALPGLARAAVPRATKSLRILILGGTGFIGPHQVRYALERGHQLTLFNRGRRPKDWPAQVTELVGDRDTGDLKALDAGEWDVCIDNPTNIPSWVRDAADKLRDRVGHYIFVSTISVYSDNSKPGADESAALVRYEGKDAMAETRDTLRANMGLYGPLKALSEAQAREQFGERTTIVRPGLIVGPGDETDRFTYWPLRLARGGEVLAPGNGSDPVQLIDARDLSEWIVRIAETRTLGTYNATGPDYPITMQAVLYGIRACTTAGAKLTWVDTEFLREHKVSPWGDMPAWVPGDGETAGFARVSNAKALAAGLNFRALASTVNDLQAWYAAQPEERKDQLRAGISSEREAQVLAAWHAKSKSAR